MEACLNNHKGQSLIELMIAMALSIILIPAILASMITTREGRAQSDQRLQASLLLEEASEAILAIKEKDWQEIENNGTFHPVNINNFWTLEDGEEDLIGIKRSITISSVNRNTSGVIVDVGGSLDPSTKKIKIDVTWNAPNSSSLQTTMYLTRYVNKALIQTSVEDFTGAEGNLSKLDSVAIINKLGGEVALTNIAYADWCKPQDFIINQINLPKLSNAIYARQGGAYLGSGDGSGESPAFINVSINTPPPPASPSASVAGTFNGAYTTNSIYSDGTYVYLSTTKTTEQVIILDLSTNPYSQIGTVTVPGGLGANSVYLHGNILFVASGEYLYSFDLTVKTGPHTTVKGSRKMIAGIWSQPTARHVVVADNRAYVGTGGSLLGLQSFSFNSDGSNIKFEAAAVLTFSQQSQGLYVDSSRKLAYIAFNNASGLSFTRGFVVVDISSTRWFIINYYPNNYAFNTQGMDPRGITVPTGNRAITVGTGGNQQYQVFDTSTLDSHTQEKTPCGGMSVNNGVYGISSILDQYNNAYSYIITGDSSNQFKIIRGGLGGTGYLSSGTFESSSFDATSSAVFNRIDFTASKSASTDIKFQLGIADPVSESCNNANYVFVGPDLTSGTYFATASAIGFNDDEIGYENPARCMRYKAYLSTTDTQKTPVLHDITINFSP